MMDLTNTCIVICWILLISSSQCQEFDITSGGLQDTATFEDRSSPDCVLRVVRDPDTANDISAALGTFCITIDAVNEAFQLARTKVGLEQSPITKRDDEPRLAEALLETTKILRDRYSLTDDEVWAGLPLLDTESTDIDTWCPQRLSIQNDCPTQVSRYRTYDGSCANSGPLGFFQGAVFQPFPRLLPPAYSDGVSQPRRTKSGKPLPHARVVSARVHRDLGYHDHAVTVMFLAWGQLLDHDITLTAEAKNRVTQTEPDCCTNTRRNPYCAPLIIPFDDPFYARYNQHCISFLRTPPALRPGCKLGPRVQNNELTSSIDASFVYGSTREVATSLRLGVGGLMATLDILPNDLKPLLPLKLQHPDEGCTRPSPNIFCFLAGDNRVNEQLLLGVLHTIMVREHNRIAKELALINPHWSDETLYQETRMIVAAETQQITYSEFLPLLLGKENMRQYNLVLEKQGYYRGHEANKDPTVPSSFATAAFRFGHSLLPSTLERWSVTHRYIASQKLSSVLRRPFDIYRPGRMDEMVLGMVNQVAQAMDDAVTSEVTQQLFKKTGVPFGRDLASINIARAREHGIPSYTSFRKYCGLSVPTTWNELSTLMGSNFTANQYSAIYESVDDVDLWSAGISERPTRGAMVGPTFSCILGKSFRQLRKADKFWFENPDHQGAFTPAQLSALRKIRFSRLLCDNGDNIGTIQAYVLVLPDPEVNPRVPCSVLPKLDLSPWKDLNSPEF